MKNIINETELNNQLEKIRLYKNEENICFDSLKHILINNEYFYNTSNKEKITDIKLELLKKINTLKNTHENYSKIININILKYKELSNKTDTIIANLER